MRRVASACTSQDATVGIADNFSGCNSPFIAPQSACPHTTMCRMSSAATAYSMVAVTPPG